LLLDDLVAAVPSERDGGGKGAQQNEEASECSHKIHSTQN
jgi:hypothetical protein